MKKFSLLKYKTIVISISIFVFMIAGVMVLNVYISTQLANDAVEISIAGRQRTISQRLFKDLLNLQRVAENGGDITAIEKQIRQTAEQFDTTLNAFINGGTTSRNDGREVTLKKISSETGLASLEEAAILWEPFKQLVNTLSTEKPNLDWMATLTQAIDYGGRHNIALLGHLNGLMVALQDASDNANAIVASGQQMLSQRLMKELLELKNTVTAGDNLNKSLENLNATVTRFDTLLTALQKGGTITDANGALIKLRPVASQTSQKALVAATKLWEPYKLLLTSLLSDAKETRWLGQLAEAVAYGRENNLTLLVLMDDLAKELERLTIMKVARLRIIQTAALIMAFLFPFIIMIHFIRQLQRSYTIAQNARAETANILNTVQEGLFLLDDNATIGSQYSTATKTIFDREEIADLTLYDILRDIVTEQDMQLTEDYITLLFGGRVNEKLITDINPLNQVEVNLEREGRFETKYLSFNFNRVYSDGKLSNLLVSINDISDKIKLQQELEELKEKSQDQLNMLTNILHVEKRTLESFLNNTAEALTNINDIFRQPQTSATNHRKKVDTIFRIIHKVKGDAAALELTSFESRAHEFEDMLVTLREQEAISGNDFLPLTVKLDEFITHHATVLSMVQRFNEMNSSDNSDSIAPETDQTHWRALEQLVQRIASEQGKQVVLQTHGLDPHTIPHKYHKTVWDIAVQLVRNAVVHGIETPYERRYAQKGDTGNLEVNFTPKSEGYELTIRDDGCGIDAEKLRAKALEQGTWGEEDLVASWDRDRLLSLIFEPGFSMASEVSKDAGRGVGMDIIKEVVEGVQGQLVMDTVTGQYCEFKVQLPK
jgi:sensor histidine kinase regulating citrate/malate metabolism